MRVLSLDSHRFIPARVISATLVDAGSHSRPPFTNTHPDLCFRALALALASQR